MDHLDRRIALRSSTAVSSFCRLGQRLIQDPINVSEYREFLAEYEILDYMTKSPPTEIVKPEQTYYIPHHVVLRDSSATTCLRVVFNASCRTSNGTSLNDHCSLANFKGLIATFLMQ